VSCWRCYRPHKVRILPCVLRLLTILLLIASLARAAEPFSVNESRALGVDSPAAGSAVIHLNEYFAASTDADRAAARAALIATGVDAVALSHLVGIHTGWQRFAAGAYYINEQLTPLHVAPMDARYFLGIPTNYDRAKAWPLIIMLPTASAFLTNPAPTPDDVQKIYTAWIMDELQKHDDAIVLMPLLNLDELYGPSPAGIATVLNAMQHAMQTVHVDPARVYLFGHSMSAHAVWNIGLHYPTYFASIAPLAGTASQRWQQIRLGNLRNTCPVVWHDADDPFQKVASSRDLVSILRRLKVDVDYLETKNVGHTPTSAIVEDRYKAMRAHTRDLYPAHVYLQTNRPDPPLNRIDWVQIMQILNPANRRNIYFQHGSGMIVTQDNPSKVEATLKDNAIDATTQNVADLRFFFSDTMIDFNKPVTIIVNHRKRFEGMVQPSLDALLADQLFLGRGWRAFSAVVDVDLEKPFLK
jgi:predicted esterase